MDLASTLTLTLTLTLTRRSFAAGIAVLACAAGLSVVAAPAARADQQAEPASDAKDASSAPTDDKAVDAPAFPITIEHAFGEIVVEQEPERVVCLAWSNMEAPLALGIAPVGYSAPNYGLVDENGTWPWVTEAYEALGAEAPVLFDDTDGFDLEAINDCEPDIILAAYSGMTQEDYEVLSKIAPTIPFPKVPWQTFWREQTVTEGTALGKAAEAEQLVRDTDALIAQKRKEYGIGDDVKGAMVMVGSGDLGTFYIYLPEDPRAAYLIDLGIQLPQSVTELAQEADPSAIALTLSAEEADRFDDLDIIVMYGDEVLLEEVQADPLLGSIPAIQKGAVALLGYDTPLGAGANPGVLGIPATIDEYLELIAQAIQKSKA